MCLCSSGQTNLSFIYNKIKNVTFQRIAVIKMKIPVTRTMLVPLDAFRAIIKCIHTPKPWISPEVKATKTAPPTRTRTRTMEAAAAMGRAVRRRSSGESWTKMPHGVATSRHAWPCVTWIGIE